MERKSNFLIEIEKLNKSFFIEHSLELKLNCEMYYKY